MLFMENILSSVRLQLTANVQRNVWDETISDLDQIRLNLQKLTLVCAIDNVDLRN